MPLAPGGLLWDPFAKGVHARRRAAARWEAPARDDGLEGARGIVSPGTPPRRYGTAAPLHGRIQRQRQLSFRLAVGIAWNNIRARLGRSMLVTSGIILALAFLTYILCSDSLARSVMANGPADLLERLEKEGVVKRLGDADARIQTNWMVGLALLVSYVGILNAMLLSVTERFAEIGTMKCLGALDRLIVELFLIESVFQGLVGTAAGIVIGLALTLAEGVSSYGPAVWSVIPFSTFAWQMAICLLSGVGLTIAGALYPAWRAAQMQPIEAMRAEV